MNIDIIKRNNGGYEVRRTTGELVDSFDEPDPRRVVEEISSLTKLRLCTYNSILRRKFIPLFDTYTAKWIIGVLDAPYDPTRYKCRIWDKFKSLNACIRDLKRLNKTDTYLEPSQCVCCGRVFILSKKESEYYVNRRLEIPKRCFECRGAENADQPRTLVDYHQEDHDMFLEFEELNDVGSIGEFLPIFTEETYTTKLA